MLSKTPATEKLDTAGYRYISIFAAFSKNAIPNANRPFFENFIILSATGNAGSIWGMVFAYADVELDRVSVFFGVPGWC